MIIPSAPMICVAELTVEPQQIAHHQLGDVRRAGRRSPPLRMRSDENFPMRFEDVEPREALAHDRVVVLAGVAGERDEPVGMPPPPPPVPPVRT